MKKIFSLWLVMLFGIAANAFEATKYYVINRNGNTSAYMYATGSAIRAGALDATKANYIWQLIPTSTTDGYYLKNVGTGQYVQTSKITLSSAVSMGDTEVEYVVSTGAGSTGSGTTYFMASNDQGTIDYTSDATLGLNYGSNGVVAYYIKTGRGNSYWNITETDYTPAPTPDPEDGEDEDAATGVHAYRIPCGTLKATTKLTMIDITGDGVWTELHYKPVTSSRYMLQTGTHAQLMRGGICNLKAALTGASVSGLVVTVLADFDGDAIFEEKQKIEPADTITCQLTVPADTKALQGRIRIRVDQGGNTSANGDFTGVVYDVPVQFVDAASERLVTVKANSAERGVVAISGVDDSSVNVTNGTSLTIMANAAEDYEFKGWLLAGDTISRDSAYTFVVTASATLQAVFAHVVVTPKPIVYVKPQDGLRFRMRNGSRNTYYLTENDAYNLVIVEDRYDEGGVFTLEAANEGTYYIRTESGRYFFRAIMGKCSNLTTGSDPVEYTITNSGDNLYNFGATASGDKDTYKYLHAANDHIYVCGWTQTHASSQWYMQADDSATAIESVQTPKISFQYGKFLKDGQIIIVKNGRRFNTKGQRML